MAASRGSKKVYELFVSKVPWTVAHKQMTEYFTQFGQVRKCALPTDKDTGFHKGFCWVTYATEEGLNNALHKEPHVLEGATLQVQINKKAPVTTQRSNKDAE